MNIDHLNLDSTLKALTESEKDALLVQLEELAVKTVLDYDPHPKQKLFHCATEKIRFLSGGNRSGKTEAGVIEDVYHLTGMYPDWYPKEKRWAVATRGRIIVTDYNKGCGEVLEPKMMKWLPKASIVNIRRTQKGHLEKLSVRHITGGISTVDILTHEQEDNAFEGWSGHWAHFDEPPPREKFIATLRGLIDFKGRAWLTLTPISEPWLYDQFVYEESKYIFYLTVDIRDNPHLPVEEITIFEASLSEDEKDARMHGKFRHLAGRVYKEFDPSVHILPEDYKLDSRWPVWFVLDPADRRPHHGIWFKVDPFNTMYIFAEIKYKGTIFDLSKEILKREIIQKINPNNVLRILDPNKGNTPTAATGLKLLDEFARHAVYFTATVNDDVALGHLAVAERLRWNKVLPLSATNHPKLYFIKNRTSECVKQLQSYVWDDWRGAGKGERSQKEQVKDVNKDMPDCVRYGVMSNPMFYTQDDTFRDPQSFSKTEELSTGFTHYGS